MTADTCPKLHVEFLGCTADPIEVIYSALQIDDSPDHPAQFWQKIRNGEITRKSMEDFVAERLGAGRISPMRQVQFVFMAENISRAGSDAINRHAMIIEREKLSRTCPNISMASLPFVSPPSFKNNNRIIKKWALLQKEIAEFHQLCSEQGVPQEDADLSLPMATVTRKQFSMGFQALQGFLDIQMCALSPWEMRDVAWQIYNILKAEFPNLASRLGIKCWENRSLFCDEDPERYLNCEWYETRPHKNDLNRILQLNRKIS